MSHSILAPSDSERWSRCVGAIYLSRGLPEVDAEYNASGTCSHWILQQSLETGTSPEMYLGKELTFSTFKFVIDQDRCDRIQLVIDQIRSEPGRMWVEKLLNTSPVLGIPGQIGHADIVKLDELGAVEINGTLHRGVLSIHDFKDGYIIVNAKNNLQGLNYLAAGLYEFDLMAPINALRFCIHQPKVNHYDEWTYTRAEIEHFIALIRPVAKLAYDIYNGTVEFDAEKHLNAGEEQCFWCPVRGRCPARAKRIAEMFSSLIGKHEIDDKQLSQMYSRLEEIEQACRDYRAEALRRALSGRKIECMKLVRGKRGARYWKDEKKAQSAMEMVLPPEELFKPVEIVSPTQAEAALKKAGNKELYASLKPYIGQEDGSLSLAPESDPREEYIVPQFKPVES